MNDTPTSRQDLARRRLQTETMLAFSRVHQQILRRTTARLEEAGITGITPARANALIVLFNARRPINGRELAQELGISEVTVSRFLRRMEDDGWVERAPDPSDGRARLLRPTRYARDLFPVLVQVSNAVLDDLFDDLDDAGLRDLSDAIQRVQEQLSEAERATAERATADTARAAG